MKENYELLNELYERSAKFSFEEFFTKDTSEENIDNGACCIITPYQIVAIKNDNDGHSSHSNTWNRIFQVIYNLEKYDITNSNIRRKYGIVYQQCIKIRMLNERGIKLVLIEFPNNISEELLYQLTEFKKLYGSILENISREYYKISKEKLIGFRDIKEKEDISSHTLDDAIKYASNNLSKNSNIIPNVYYINNPNTSCIKK